MRVNLLIIIFLLSLSAFGQDFKKVLTDTTLIKKDLWKKERLSYYLNSEDLKDDDYTSYYNRGLKKMQDSLFLEAIPDFKKAISEDKYYTENIPELNKNQFTAEIIDHIATCHYLLNNQDSALIYYRKIIEINPYYEPAWLGIASIFFERGDYDSTINSLAESIDVIPGSPALQYNLGIAYLQKNQKNKAKQIQKELIASFPEYERSYILLGVIYLLEGKYNYAINTFSRSIEINSDFALAYMMRGSTYMTRAEYEEAYEDYKNYYKHDTLNPKVNVALAILGIKFGDKSNAYDRLFPFMKNKFIDPQDIDIANPRSIESDYIWRQLISGTVEPEEMEYVKLFLYEIIWGNRKHAQQLLNDYTAVFPESLYAKRFLVAMYHRKNFNDGFETDQLETVTRIEGLIDMAPDSAIFWFLKGNALTFYDTEESIKAYKQGLQLQTDYSYAYCQIGDLFSYLDKFDSAIVSYSEAIQKHPDYFDAYYGRAISYEEIPGKKRFAIEEYRHALTIEPGLFGKTIQKNIASCYADLDRYDSALVYLDILLESSPVDFDLREKKGFACLQLGEYDTAIQIYSKIIDDYNKEYIKNPHRARSYFERGNAYYYKKLYHQAINDYMSALEIYPDNASAFGALGDCYRKMGEPNRAIEYYDKALASTVNKWYHYKKGICYYQTREYLKGIMCYMEAIKIDSSFAEAYYEVGYHYYKLGRYSQSIGFSKKVLDIDPTLYSAAFNIALVLLHQGRYEDAEMIYRNTKSLSDSQENPDYQKNIADLQTLLTDEKLKTEAQKILVGVFNVKM